ncbi:MAG: transporter substrate-binding domain-containing protein [Clostridiales bacterium]|nr:transporter substrate-binding domain-containing protein [Clostridiales bacterium]
MATNAAFPPYEFYENEKIVGIDAEVAAAIADKLGMKLVIEDMEFGSIITAVTSGKVDMGMAGMTVSDERKQSVDFSATYATGIQAIIVKEGSPIKTVDDLYAEDAKYVVAVQQDTTGDLYSTDDFGDARVQRFNKGADAVQALITGKDDLVIIDNEPAKAFVATNNK